MEAIDKKQHIINTIKKYVDQDNAVDLKLFREECKSEYFLVNHYFGSIDNLLTQINAKRSVSSYGGASLRNKFALAFIEDCRKKGKTYDEIGKTFNVSRAAVSALHKKLTQYLPK